MILTTYTNDLVRRAASIKIARKVGALEIPLHEACETILDGCRNTLKLGGSAVTLAEEAHILESLGIAELESPEHFLRNLNRLSSSRRDCPAAARQGIEKSLPEAVSYKIVARTAGTGSLGQLRFVAIAEWKGGSIAREAKEMRPPASAWKSGKGAKNCYYNELMESAVRAHDPFQKVINGWLIRRLSTDCNPIAIADWPKKRDEFSLIRSMGREAANVPLGTRHQVDKILDHLNTVKASWLRFAQETWQRRSNGTGKNIAARFLAIARSSRSLRVAEKTVGAAARP
jgi:hypothetical protein